MSEPLGIYVGWTVRGHSFACGMPLRNETGDRLLVFSGEEFSGPGVIAELQSRGHCVGAEGPDYLIHVAEEASDFPRSLNGRFHGLLVNLRDGLATLFNDRYGMHRIYCHQGQEAFYFSAEAKAILTVCPETRAIDPVGMGEFISCGCALENRTLFKGIDALPPGSAWGFRNRALEHKGTYFDCREWEEQTPLGPETFYRELRDVFSRILPRYFQGSEKVGISLTGGLDTRMIMAWHKSDPGALPCYSFGGMFRDCQDVIMARRIAQACVQEHQVITVGKDFLSRFPHYAERAVLLTDGCVEVKRSPDLYINERAAAIGPVRMTGNFGGEVFRGVRAFKPVDVEPGPFDTSVSPDIQRASQTYQRLAQTHPVTFSVFRQAPWHNYGIICLEESQLSLRTPYLDNELVRIAYRAPLPALSSDATSLRLIADGNQELARIRTDRGVGGNHPGPLAALQRAYLEFTFKADYAYDYGMPQRVAQVDHALAPLHLERLFLGRHKFYHFRVWYRDALAGYVRDVLLDSRSLARPYLQRRSVESLISAHVKGDRNYTTAIHKLLTLELIHRLFIDSQ